MDTIDIIERKLGHTYRGKERKKERKKESKKERK